MRYISKLPEPKEFTEWKAMKNDDWEPSYDKLINPEKSILVSSLIKEQGYLCCYCGISIDRGVCHIEHLKPQENYSTLRLEYSNMLASCNGVVINQHCGQKKGNWYDEDKLVSPLNPSCESYFQFTSAGEILHIDDRVKEQAAKETILKLKLDHNMLIKRRKKALEGVLDDIDTLSSPDIQKLIDNLNQPDGDGKLTQFCFVLQFVLKQYL
jgi:uncharacterized protein (TIGR02646 family)